MKSIIIATVLKICFVFIGVMSMFSEIFGNNLIKWQKHKFSNGLTLILNEDKTVQNVAVYIHYKVGSGDESYDLTGLAHFFEHIAFSGSKHIEEDYLPIIAKRHMASDYNGFTSFDRTVYYQVVPTAALDSAIRMEADRMCCLVPDPKKNKDFKKYLEKFKEKIEKERLIVLQEKARSTTNPYSVLSEAFYANAFPKYHPYHHPIIGYENHIKKTSFEDMKNWLKKFYGPQNVVISLAGNVSFDNAKKLVGKYFSNIEPTNTTFSSYQSYMAQKSEKVVKTLNSRDIPEDLFIKEFNIPGKSDENINDSHYISILSEILTSGKDSRLYKILVDDHKIAKSVTSSVSLFRAAGIFYIKVTPKNFKDMDMIDKLIDDELNAIIKDNLPTEDEITVVKKDMSKNFLKDLQSLYKRAAALANGEAYKGDPGYYQKRYEIIEKAKPENLIYSAKKWLGKGQLVLKIRSLKDLKASKIKVDRSIEPSIEKFKPYKLPVNIIEFKLKNGLHVILNQNKKLPIIFIDLMFNTGHVYDEKGKIGLINFLSEMIGERTKTRDNAQISKELKNIATDISTYSSLKNFGIYLDTSSKDIVKALDIFADILLNPVFDKLDIDKVRVNEILPSIKEEKADSLEIGFRVLLPVLYKKNHPYAKPLSGLGYENDIMSINSTDLNKAYNRFVAPNNASLVITGDIDKKTIEKILNKKFAKWLPNNADYKLSNKEIKNQKKSVFIVDKKGTKQIAIIAAKLIPSFKNHDLLAFDVFNSIFGGSFTSRLNQDIREKRKLTYNIRSRKISNNQTQEVLVVYLTTDQNKTNEAINAISDQFISITDNITSEEIYTANVNISGNITRSLETISSTNRLIKNFIHYGLQEDINNYLNNIYKVHKNKLFELTKNILGKNITDEITWVLVGDKDFLQKSIDPNKFGDVNIISLEDLE